MHLIVLLVKKLIVLLKLYEDKLPLEEILITHGGKSTTYLTDAIICLNLRKL